MLLAKRLQLHHGLAGVFLPVLAELLERGARQLEAAEGELRREELGAVAVLVRARGPEARKDRGGGGLLVGVGVCAGQVVIEFALRFHDRLRRVRGQRRDVAERLELLQRLPRVTGVELRAGRM